MGFVVARRASWGVRGETGREGGGDSGDGEGRGHSGCSGSAKGLERQDLRGESWKGSFWLLGGAARSDARGRVGCASGGGI